MSLRVHITGLYSGPSPSPGLGVALSLKSALPDLKLIGIDHYAGSSGLHHSVFDDAWVFPPWNLIDQDKHAAEVKSWLDQGHIVFPNLDLEIAWLATHLKSHPRLLAPSARALEAVAKPRAPAAEYLPFRSPVIMEANEADSTLADFCRAHSWRVWLKGPFHEAVLIRNWRQFEACRHEMTKRWQTDALFLQAHVQGHEESICFAAHEGELLDVVHMRKRQTTSDGKTWAGRIRPLGPELRERLAFLLRKLNWTGAGEIEVLCEPAGENWFMEWNPRFPAWIYGATLAGHNLPAQLMARVLGRELPRPQAAVSQEFTRIVTEIPVHKQLPLPVPLEPLHQGVVQGKYAASMGSLLHSLRPPVSGFAKDNEPGTNTWTIDEPMLAELKRLRTVPSAQSPQRIFLEETAERNFVNAARQATAASIRLGFSIKTAPDERYLQLAKRHGMLAECISQLEVKRALQLGWSPSEIILNGPGKWWPDPEKIPQGLFAVFCDSLPELERLITSGRQDHHWGIRLKIPGQGSRFGIDLDDPDDFRELCQLIARFPTRMGCGIHVHMSPAMLGQGLWLDSVGSALSWAESIAEQTGRSIPLFDVGGGYHPRDFAHTPFEKIQKEAKARLPGLIHVIAEPGRALTQENMVIQSRVLDVRRSKGELSEVILDASIAELPLAGSYPHRFIWAPENGAFYEMKRGPVRVLGRICMEDDILSAGLNFPDSVKLGDRIIIADAGAYERSMAYEFAHGGLGSTEGMADSPYL